MRYSRSEFNIPLRYLRTKRLISTSNAEFTICDTGGRVYGNRLDKHSWGRDLSERLMEGARGARRLPFSQLCTRLIAKYAGQVLMGTDLSKLIEAINRVGIQNVSLLSRMTGMPTET